MSQKSQQKFYRKCPKCGGEQLYKNHKQLLKGIRNNTVCKSCRTQKQELWKFSKRWNEQFVDRSKEVYKKECPRCKKEQFYTNKRHLIKMMRKNSVCRECQLIIRKPTSLGNPNYNPLACKYFDELNKQNGWNLQHALNGGEVKVHRYWVDAYDKQNNIVVEYDEPKHYTKEGSLIPYDLRRMNTIIKVLNCKFYRYNELKRLLYEVNLRQIPVIETAKIVNLSS